MSENDAIVAFIAAELVFHLVRLSLSHRRAVAAAARKPQPKAGDQR